MNVPAPTATAPASPEMLSLLSHIQGPTKINGLVLRPITLGSHSLCMQAGSKLVAGAVAEITNLTFEVLLFIYVHTAPLDEVCDVVFDPVQLRRKVFALGDTFPLSSVDSVSKQILAELDKAMAGMVSPERKTNAADEAREAHGGKA